MTVCKAKWTALHIASQNGHEEVVRLLLDRGADINIVDKVSVVLVHYHYQSVTVYQDNCTALYIASSFGHEDVVQLLLGRGASTAVSNKVDAADNVCACCNDVVEW